MSIHDIYFSNFGRPPVPDDLCKESAPRHPRFWRRRFLKFFTIYGHGGHLGQWTILAIFRSPNLRRLHMKFEQNWLRGFRGGHLKMLTDEKWSHLAHPEHSSGELKTEGLQETLIHLQVTIIIAHNCNNSKTKTNLSQNYFYITGNK